MLQKYLNTRISKLKKCAAFLSRERNWEQFHTLKYFIGLAKARSTKWCMSHYDANQ